VAVGNSRAVAAGADILVLAAVAAVGHNQGLPSENHRLCKIWPKRRCRLHSENSWAYEHLLKAYLRILIFKYAA
jgi:hypothetical protein